MRAGDDRHRSRSPIPTEVDDVGLAVAGGGRGRRLSYPADAPAGRSTSPRCRRSPPSTALVRHAHAGERKKWAGNDALRPIDAQGQAEAETLAEVVALFAAARG